MMLSIWFCGSKKAAVSRYTGNDYNELGGVAYLITIYMKP